MLQIITITSCMYKEDLMSKNISNSDQYLLQYDNLILKSVPTGSLIRFVKWCNT